MLSLIFSCIWILPLLYLHAFRFREDYAVQSEISVALKQTGTYQPGSLFAEADHVCFLTQYMTVGRDFPIQISEKSRSELKLKINMLFGQDDTVWWIIGFRNGNVAFLYRMDSKLEDVTRNRIVCVDAKNFILQSAKPSRSSRYDTETIFFDIVNKE